MAAYPPYKPQFGIYNNNNFSKQPSGNDGLTIDTAKLYFLQFPNAQTSQTEFLHSIGVGSDATFNGPVVFNEIVTYNQDIEFLANVIVDGTATVTQNLLCDSTATISDVLTCENGIDISTLGTGITFPDNSFQSVAYDDTTVVQIDQANTFQAGFTQTFDGSVDLGDSASVGSSTGTVTGLTINNASLSYLLSPRTNFGLAVINNAGNSTLALSDGGGNVASLTCTAPQTLNFNGASITTTGGANTGAISCTTINTNGNTITGNIYNGTQINGSNFSLRSTVGGGPTNFNYYTSGNCMINMAATDTLLISNLGTSLMTLSPVTGINAYQNLGMNNKAIVNTSNIQIGGLSANYTELTQGGSTFGINNLYPNSSNPQISLAVFNPGGSLTGLTIAGNLATLGTPLSLSGYNITNVGKISGFGASVTTDTPPNNAVPTAIATTQYVETAIASIPSANVPFIYGTTASISWDRVTTGYFNGNYAPSNNGSYDQIQGGTATITFTVPKDPNVYPVVVNANMQGNITYPTGGTNLNASTGQYQPFSSGSTPYGWNGLQMLWGYGCSVQAPILTGGFGVTVNAQTFFSAHLNTNNNVGVNNNPFTTVSFMVYQS
jgi:hypothetical protein